MPSHQWIKFIEFYVIEYPKKLRASSKSKMSFLKTIPTLSKQIKMVILFFFWWIKIVILNNTTLGRRASMKHACVDEWKV